MAIIDVESLLKPISETLPCGENLEYDPAFVELERIAKGKEAQWAGDKMVKEAEEPKWPEVAEAAQALLERTRDLRVAVHLTHAALNIEGVAGLSAGLRLIHGLLDSFWESVHPELDKEDDNDPTFRLNSLAALDVRDGLLRSLGRAPLVVSRAAGRYGLRDIRLARGELERVGEEKIPDGALVDAAFADCDAAELAATADAAREAATAAAALIAVLQQRVGSYAPTFDNLVKELGAIRTLLDQQLERRGLVTVATAQGENAQGDPSAAAGPPAVRGIRSRDDAAKLIDDVSEYFRKNEPSSPVPLLLERAKRLIAKDFIEILRDLTPKAVSDAEAIGGLSNKD